MTYEIPYSNPSPAAPGTARVLMRDGKWVVPAKERPDDWRDRQRPVDDIRQARDIHPYPQRSERLGTRAVGRPRIHPPKAHPHAGRGKAWNRRESVTDEQVIALRHAGHSFTEIGHALGIERTTAYKRWAAAGRKEAATELDQEQVNA